MILHPEEQIKYSAILESLFSLGGALGPVVGSVLYYLIGYFFMFVVMSIFFLVFIIPLIATMPSNINDNDDSVIEEDGDLDLRSQIESNISYYKLLSDPLILLSLIAFVLLVTAFSYFEPLLSFRLDDFTHSVIIQGLIFSFLVVGNATMALFVPYFSKFASPVKLITFSLF